MRAGVTRILSAHPGSCAGAGMPAYAHENGSGIARSAMSWQMRPGRIRGMPAGPYVE